VTPVRFDVAWHGLFKCNPRPIADCSALGAHQARILAMPGVRDSVSIDNIKRDSYSIKALNPTGIVPKWPRAARRPRGIAAALETGLNGRHSDAGQRTWPGAPIKTRRNG
jgi:putative glutathione S-transferase